MEKVMKKYFTFVLFISFSISSCSHQETTAFKILINRVSFPSSQDALVYMLERRLQIQRLYENSSEPYFGKPEEKKCKENIELDGRLKKEIWGEFLSLNVLVNDHLAIGDCMLENNTKRALYEFYHCDKEVIERRSYTDINVKLPKAPTSKCGL